MKTNLYYNPLFVLVNIGKIISNIENLKIQGATNVALAALDVFQYTCQTSKTTRKSQFKKELQFIRKKLFATRPTEPMMRNAIRFAMHINFEKYKVTVIIPAYNEEKTIGDVVDDYRSNAYVDEVVVVDTNSTDDKRSNEIPP